MSGSARLKLAGLTAAAMALLWAGAAQAQELCQTVADRLSNAPALAASDDAWRSPAAVLAGLPDPVLHLDAGKRLSQQEALDFLTGDLHATSRLIAAVKSLSDSSKQVKLQRFGQSALYVAIAEEGTASCQSFVFFTAAGRQADLTDAPPIVRDRPEGDLICSGFGRYALAGDVGRQPALFVEDGRDRHDDINITPWRDGRWQQACTIGVDFSARFAVKLRSCKELDCTRTGEQVRTLVTQYDKDPKGFARNAAAEERFKSSLSGPSELPSFGQPVDTPLTFGEESDVLRVSFDGKDYIARVGHGAIGWRRYPDYLFVLYRVAGDELDPIAAFQIAKTRGAPTKVVVK